MITNKDVRVENGNIVINGDKYPLDGQSPAAIMQIVKDNSDTTPTASSTNPVESGGVYSAIGDLTQTGLAGVSVADQLKDLNDDLTLEKFTVTLASAIGTPTQFDSNCFYNPKTKQVHLDILIYSSDSLIPSSGNVVFTVPTNCRPAVNTQLGLATVTNNYTTLKAERCLIETNGDFILNNFIYNGQSVQLFAIKADYISA